jgi:hypothetical protein
MPSDSTCSDRTTAYNDSMSSPTGADRPSARLLSNVLASRSLPRLNAEGLSEMTAAWAQFIADDLVRWVLFVLPRTLIK